MKRNIGRVVLIIVLVVIVGFMAYYIIGRFKNRNPEPKYPDTENVVVNRIEKVNDINEGVTADEPPLIIREENVTALYEGEE